MARCSSGEIHTHMLPRLGENHSHLIPVEDYARLERALREIVGADEARVRESQLLSNTGNLLRCRAQRRCCWRCAKPCPHLLPPCCSAAAISTKHRPVQNDLPAGR
jgi:hypothetical protein